MTLEISEIGVRLTVGSPATPVTKPAADAAGGQGGASISPKQFDELVKACVQEVLGALRMIEER